MLPRRYRLDRERIATLSQERPLHGRFVSLRFSPTASGVLVAVSVSKKVHAKAANRNKLKRRLREICADLIRSGLPPGHYLVSAKREARGASFAELLSDLHSLTAGI